MNKRVREMAEKWEDDTWRKKAKTYPDGSVSLRVSPKEFWLEGFKAAVEMAAETCIRLWKESPNDRASDFMQNKVSHGCVASEKRIRALIAEDEK